MINKNFGFTLIEALVVVGIIGILATTVLLISETIRNNNRDLQRVNDITTIRGALNMYYSKYNQYPTYITPNERFEFNSIIYLEKVPSNPIPRPKICADQDYIYTQTNNGTSYTINFCLGSKQADLEAGYHIAIPEGIIQDYE